MIALVLAALVAGVGLALLLGSDGEPERPATTVTAPGDPYEDTTETFTALLEGQPTATPPTTEHTSEAPAPVVSPRDEREIEQAVADAAAAVEAGSPPPGIAPGDLPGTDELSIDSVRAEGDRGSATLSSGAVVQLERSGDRWRIVGVRGS
jgi:hypothetical protein